MALKSGAISLNLGDHPKASCAQDSAITERGAARERAMVRKKSRTFHIVHSSSVPYSDYEQPRFGTDVSSKRYDELDSRTIIYGMALKRGRPDKLLNFIDLGAGLGIQSVRMALLGYRSFAYDLSVAPQTIASIAQIYQVGSVRYLTGDLATISPAFFPKPISIIYSQRFIHYLRFDAAVRLLTSICHRTRSGGHLFLSAAGFETEIAEKHPDRSRPVADRFAVIDSDIAREHCVTAPLCIYRLSDLELVANLAGFDTVDCWLTEFGNVQGVFSKR